MKDKQRGETDSFVVFCLSGIARFAFIISIILVNIVECNTKDIQNMKHRIEKLEKETTP